MLGWQSKPPCQQQQGFLSAVGGAFLLLLTRPAIKYSSALVQTLQIKICTDNSLNLCNIASFVCRKKKPRAGNSFQTIMWFKWSEAEECAGQRQRAPTFPQGLKEWEAGWQRQGSRHFRCLTVKGSALSRPRRCPGLLWPIGSGSWVPAGRCPTGRPEQSGKGWKNCPDLCRSATWSAPSSLICTTTATPGRERKKDLIVDS